MAEFSRETIQMFIDFTGRDAETARRFLSVSNGDAVLAVSRYFSLSDIIEFTTSEPETTEPPSPSPAPVIPPPENPPEITPEFSRTNDEDVSTILTLPFGGSKIENVHIEETFEPAKADEIYRTEDTNIPHVTCTIWRNGISIDDRFIPTKCESYEQAMKQIEQGMIPNALIPDIELCDMELIYNCEVGYDSAV